MYVVDRLLQATARIDYPRDLLEIQVLDDSTDETTGGGAARRCDRLVAQGFDVKYLHRTNRTGFKAGALDAGLKVARGEFVAIFDADFIPSPDFLQKTVPYFQDPKVALVQARWGHVNADYSLLTKVAGHPARRRTSCSSTAAATAPGTSSTSTARPASGGARSSRRRAAGSTTR